MILSSCGCKVSWALRGVCGFCGSLPGLRVLSTQQTRCVRHPCFCKQSCRPRFGKIHRILPNHPSPNLRIFRWGRWCDTRVQLCAGNAINADNSFLMLRGLRRSLRQQVVPPTAVPVLPGRYSHALPIVPVLEKFPLFS